MVTNYYNASNNFSAPVRREPKPFRPPSSESEQTKEHGGEANAVSPKKWISEKPDQDAVFIIALVLLLLLSGCNDTLLFVALAYLILF